jgi:hypothetical protein
MAVPLDTSPEAHQVQIEAYRRMGGPGRLAVVFRLNELVRDTAKSGIRSRHPEYDEEQVHLAYARLVLGDELVREVWPGRSLVQP